MNSFRPGGSRSAQRLPGGGGTGGNSCVYDPNAVYMQKIHAFDKCFNSHF